MITLRSSLAAAAIGLDTNLSRYRAYRLLAHGEEPERSGYAETLFQFGHDHEAEAVGWVEATLDKMFFQTGENQVTHEALRYTATPDGNDLEGMLLEVKCRAPGLGTYEPGDKHWQKYMVQVQLAMQVVGAECCAFCCYRPDKQFGALWVVEKSDEYYQAFKHHADEFFRFLDGEAECPKRMGRRPELPPVEFEPFI